MCWLLHHDCLPGCKALLRWCRMGTARSTCRCPGRWLLCWAGCCSTRPAAASRLSTAGRGWPPPPCCSPRCASCKLWSACCCTCMCSVPAAAAQVGRQVRWESLSAWTTAHRLVDGGCAVCQQGCLGTAACFAWALLGLAAVAVKAVPGILFLVRYTCLRLRVCRLSLPAVRTRPSARVAASGRLPGMPAGSSPIAAHRISFDSEDDEVAVEDVRLALPAASGGPAVCYYRLLSLSCSQRRQFGSWQGQPLLLTSIRCAASLEPSSGA